MPQPQPVRPKPTAPAAAPPVATPSTAEAPASADAPSERVQLEVEVLTKSAAVVRPTPPTRVLALLLLALLTASASAQERATTALATDRTAQLTERLTRAAGAPPSSPTTELMLRSSASKRRGNAIVNTTVYEQDGSCADGDCSIVDALGVAAGGGGTVTFDPSLNGATITFNTTVGAPSISGAGSVIIDASALSDSITFSGDDVMQLLIVSSGADVTVKNIIFTNGSARSGGAIVVEGDATLTVEDCTVTRSEAEELGGGIYVADAHLHLRNSTISYNTAALGGGVVQASLFGGSLTIEGSTVVGNTALPSDGDGDGDFDPGQGGGLFALGVNVGSSGPSTFGMTTITNSTFRDNTATGTPDVADAVAEGGGLYLSNGTNTLTFELTNVTVTGNESESGGGLYLSGDHTVASSTIEDNTSTQAGGGILVDDGDVTVSQSTIEGNRTEFFGGGIYQRRGDLTITDGTLSSNVARMSGGGLEHRGTVNLVRSTVSGNLATLTSEFAFPIQGGGIASYGSLTVSASLIASNRAGTFNAPLNDVQGGGLYVGTGGLVSLSNTTVFGNFASRTVIGTIGGPMIGRAQGGGIYVGGDASLSLTNTTLSGNGVEEPSSDEGASLFFDGGTLSLNGSVIEAGDVTDNVGCALGSGATIATNAYAFVSDGTCDQVDGGTPTGFLSGDPLLADALAGNGGPTQTLLPADDSPLIDAGSCAGLSEDQRGETRPYNASNGPYPDADDGCDIGAVELQGDELPPPPACDGECYLQALDAAAGDQFGYAVSISGEYALIGARFEEDNGTDSGSAYIFVQSGGAWIQQAKLTASDGAANDAFGSAVAISGDYALVGAEDDDDDGDGSGSAYVFVRSGTTWTQQAKLTAGDAAAGDDFGRAVSLSPSGDRALIGAFFDDDDGSGSGSAYVFVRSGTTWTQEEKLTANDAAGLDLFGRSVSLTDERALIGAANDDDDGASSGSAYVFARSGSTWTQQAKLTAGDAAAGDFFGYSVSLSDDHALVGASSDDDAGSASGSAYVFARSGSTWTQQAKLTAGDAATSDNFGYSVALEDDYALVGAYRDDDAGSSSGSAYLFQRSGSTWSQSDKLVASDAATNDEFGRTVSISVGRALIGSFRNSDAGTSSGSAYVFTFAPGLPVELTAFSAQQSGERTLLTWHTASETNNAGFFVEQHDGDGWAERGFVAGVGTTAEAQAYSFALGDLAPGTHVFRLRQMDYDGAASYSPEVEVLVTLAEAFRIGSVWPNPARSSAQIELAVREAQRVRVALYDALGRRVAVAFDEAVEAQQAQQIALPTRGLASGAYLVRVEGERFAQVQRITVVR